MAQLSHLSFSTLSDYDYCSMIVFWKKVIGLSQPSNKHLDFGKLYHDNVDAYHKGQEYDAELIKDYTAIIPKEFYVETEVKKDIEICGVKIKLVIDGYNADGLWDLKTYGKSMSQKMADESLQATIYCYWHWLANGVIPKFNFLVFRKDVKAKMDEETDPKKLEKLRSRLFQTISTTRTLEQLKSLDNVFAQLQANIENDLFVRTNDTYKCNGCGFRRVCL